MNYTSFCEKFTALLSNCMIPEARLLREKIQKNNGVRLDALIISNPRFIGAPVIYLEPFYELYKCGASMEDLCSIVLSGLKGDPPVPETLVSALRDFEAVRDRLVFRLVSRVKNREFLETVPWVPFLDLAVIFALHLGNCGSQRISTVIHSRQAECWGTSPSELYSIAKENTPRVNPPVLSDLEELLFGKLCPTAKKEQKFCPDREDSLLTPVYVLTNESGIYGAACMLYDNIIKDFADRIGSDLIILPSSVHEVLLVPDFSFSCESCRRMVRNVNQNDVPMEDVLSDEVYLFSRTDSRGIIRWTSSCADTPETAETVNP